MSKHGNRECSWWDEQSGAEVINTATLSEYFCDHIQLPDWEVLSKGHFPKFVRFLHAEYPHFESLAFFLWPDIGG